MVRYSMFPHVSPLSELACVKYFQFILLFTEACIKVHPNHSEAEVENEIKEVLKHAPSKPGGSRFKVTC